MKKYSLLLLSILSCGAAFALPIGNPSAPSLLYDGVVMDGGDYFDPCSNWDNSFSFRFGFYGDYVFNRHLETNDHSDIEHAQLFTNAGYLALNLWDRFDLFATVGVTNFELESNAFTFGSPIAGRIDLDYNSRFSWSFGARWTLLQCCNTNLGVEAQYFSFNPSLKRITFDDTLSLYPSNFLSSYREWQVGLGLSHQINFFVPYVGVKWSRAKLSDNQGSFIFSGDNTITFENLRSSKRWGWAAGVTLVACEIMDVTVEGRFGDEKAVYVDGQIRF